MSGRRQSVTIVDATKEPPSVILPVSAPEDAGDYVEISLADQPHVRPIEVFDAQGAQVGKIAPGESARFMARVSRTDDLQGVRAHHGTHYRIAATGSARARRGLEMNDPNLLYPGCVFCQIVASDPPFRPVTAAFLVFGLFRDGWSLEQLERALCFMHRRNLQDLAIEAERMRAVSRRPRGST